MTNNLIFKENRRNIRLLISTLAIKSSNTRTIRNGFYITNVYNVYIRSGFQTATGKIQ